MGSFLHFAWVMGSQSFHSSGRERKTLRKRTTKQINKLNLVDTLLKHTRLHPQAGLDVESDDTTTTPLENTRRLISHKNIVFWREQIGLPSLPENGLRGDMSLVWRHQAAREKYG